MKIKSLADFAALISLVIGLIAIVVSCVGCGKVIADAPQIERTQAPDGRTCYILRQGDEARGLSCL